MNVCRYAFPGSWYSRVAQELQSFWYLSPEAPRLRRWRPLLQVSSAIYQLACEHQRKRMSGKGSRRNLSVPVISVGNLVVGGTGKTPMSMWLADHFRRQGRRTAVLSRGYGRSTGEVREVPLDADRCRLAERFGDEPVLMSLKLGGTPVWVGKSRYQCGLAAIRQSRAELLILDDGFQHWALHRDLDLVLLDTGNPFGNGWLLPLGPLREPVGHLNRAGAVIVTQAQDAAGTQLLRDQLRRRLAGKPVFACRYRMAQARWGLSGPPVPWEVLRNQPAVVFAGIARPESFFQAVRSLGVKIVAGFVFPDHHPFQPKDIRTVVAPVLSGEARLILTTEKDAVRLPVEFQEMVVTLAVELDFAEDHSRFVAFLEERLGCPPVDTSAL
jgi:tetraacyldisaccharide 4'-kinase